MIFVVLSFSLTLSQPRRLQAILLNYAMNYITVKLRCCVEFFFFSRFVFLIVVLFIVLLDTLEWALFFTIPKTIWIFLADTPRIFLFRSKAQLCYNVVTPNTHKKTLLFKRQAIEVFFSRCLETSLRNQLSIQLKQSIELCAKIDGFFSLSSGMSHIIQNILFILMERVMIFSFEIVNRMRFNAQDSKYKVYLMR